MISVAKENYKNGGSFKLQNPQDPTTHVVAPYVDESRYHRTYGDSIVNERGGESHGIRLSPEQLAEIERAKRKAGVK